jgi:hypothetical protein
MTCSDGYSTPLGVNVSPAGRYGGRSDAADLVVSDENG